MSPEQATKPTAVDTPADVWSVGIMLYEALCGELPFDGESPHAVILHACTREPTPLLERVPEVHEDIRALVDLCLKKDPLQRPANGGVLHASLAALLRRDDVRASLHGPAAAPSFRLSHSTAPTQLKQEVASAAPIANSGGDIQSLQPAPSSRKLMLFAMIGLVTAALAGVTMARMDVETVAEAPDAPTVAPDETPTSFTTPPEPEPLVPIEVEAEPEPAEEVIDSPPEDEILERAERRVRPVRRAPELAEPEELEEPEEPEELEVSPEPEVVTPEEPVAMVETSVAAMTAPPVQAVMHAEPEPTPTTRAPVTMRPRMRPTMRTRPTEMRPERPDFVTF